MDAPSTTASRSPTTSQDAIVLGLETSGRVGSVAIRCRGGRVVEVELPPTGRGHARSLVAEIDRLLRSVELRPGDVGAVAVSVGPGSFTGLRVGVVAAKTLARAVGIPLVAIDTFDAIAAAVPTGPRSWIVCDDAHRGDVFVGRYTRDTHDAVRRIAPIAIEPVDDWVAGLRGDDLLTGPGCARFAELIGERCRFVPEQYRQARAGQVVALAAVALERGDRADPIALEPIYLRRSSAEVKWERLHGPG